MIRPRFIAKALAAFGGYFWLPCEICGEPFAGFEWGKESLMASLSTGKGVCNKPECEAEARKRNEALYERLGTRIVRAS